MPFTNQTEEKQIERAVLVGLSCPSFNTDQDADERTMDELRALAETAGAEAVAMTLQRRPAPDARTFIGEGKAEEVKQLAEMNDASLILFDNELSPSQMSNLEELTGRTVLDRSALILDIFAQRARTGEGIDDLLTAIEKALGKGKHKVKLCIPYSDGAVLDMLHREAQIDSTDYAAEGTIVEAVVDDKTCGRVSTYIMDNE